MHPQSLVAFYPVWDLHNQYADETMGIQGTPMGVEVQQAVGGSYAYMRHMILLCFRCLDRCPATKPDCGPQLSSLLFLDARRGGRVVSQAGRMEGPWPKIPTVDTPHGGKFVTSRKIPLEVLVIHWFWEALLNPPVNLRQLAVTASPTAYVRRGYLHCIQVLDHIVNISSHRDTGRAGG